MELMDADREQLGIPEAEYHAFVRMSSADFVRLCKYLSIIGHDTVVISVSEEGLKFFSSGDHETARVLFKQNSEVAKPEEATIIGVDEPVFLTDSNCKVPELLCKGETMSNTVTISLSNDLQAVVEYEIGGMGYVRFYLVC